MPDRATLRAARRALALGVAPPDLVRGCGGGGNYEDDSDSEVDREGEDSDEDEEFENETAMDYAEMLAAAAKYFGLGASAGGGGVVGIGIGRAALHALLQDALEEGDAQGRLVFDEDAASAVFVAIHHYPYPID